MEAGDQLGFGFGQIEGNAVRFGDGGGEIAEEADDLRDDVPARNEVQVVAALALDDSLKFSVPASSSTPTTEIVSETS